MSDVLSREQRERLAAMERDRVAALRRALPPDRVETFAKRGAALGCLLVVLLLVLGLAAIVAKLWRQVFGG